MTPSCRRWARVVRITAVLLTTTACYTYRSAAASQPVGGTVRVTFTSPRAVSVTRSGNQLTVAEATEVIGSVERVAGDTLHLRVARVRGPRGVAPGLGTTSTTAIARDPGIVVERLGFNRGRTFSLFAGFLAAIGLFMIITHEEDQPVFVT